VLFNSVEYFLFLPLALSVHLALPRRFQWIWLLCISYYFYASWSVRHVLLMVGNTLVAYAAGLLLERYTAPRLRKRIVAVSATLLLGTLFAFKYFGFARDSLTALFHFLGVDASLPVLEVVLGVCLVVGVLTRGAGLVSALLNLAFIVAITSVWARGIEIECGCFGGGGAKEGASSAYPWEIARDAGLFLLSVYLVWSPRTRLALDNLIFRRHEGLDDVEEERTAVQG